MARIDWRQTGTPAVYLLLAWWCTRAGTPERDVLGYARPDEVVIGR